MGTGEKRCNDCGWEFYECELNCDINDDGSFNEILCCPECGSTDWEYKLIGTKY